ncbi:MAG: hypothetical protein KC613_10150, partial [Myxococcales bacterium]|nr:hypothetical protein [Myxococcales bacterium]
AGHEPTPEPAQRLRETPYRLAPGQARWWKDAAPTEPGLSDATWHLLKAWRAVADKPMRGPTPSERQELLERFTAWLLAHQRRKSEAKTLQDARRIETETVRGWLAESDQPSFLPQLAHYTNLRLQVLPQAVAQLSVRAVHAAAVSHQADLVVILAPGARPALQSQFLAQQRRGGTGTVALISDPVLVRLLRPVDGQAPDPLRGLLEVVLEQQRWSSQQPFDPQDGAEIKPEMFVGRRDALEALSRQGSYGRIFAGRKLGKTALLRNVAKRAGRRELPSGRELTAVHLNIGGIHDEGRVVVRIAQALEAALEVPLLEGAERATEADPRQALEAVFRDALAARPKTSLLVLLDEADQFVAGQAAAYRAHRDEASLTWAMRNRVESRQDRQGLPLVRFVFCGYRETWRAEGAFANWRGLLQLKPLSPEEAQLLVAGPLARLGIDAAAVAPDIAWRCGNQPALLHDFGKALVEHLQDTVPVDRRAGFAVTPDQVALVGQRPELRDKVADVVWLNFVGNPRGELVFCALLLMLADAPWAALEDVPRQVRQRLQTALSPTGLAAVEEAFDRWDDGVEAELRKLVSRELLAQNPPPGSGYRLAFPQHLPILLRGDTVSRRLSDAAHRLTAAGRADGDWVLPDDALDRLSWLLGPDGAELGVREVQIPTLWKVPFQDPNRGLAVRVDVALKPSATGFACAHAPERGVRLLDLPALRAALEAPKEGCERVVLGRLDEGRLLAWLTDTRTLEFADPDAGVRLMRATGGIPLLVGALDALLVERLGEGALVEGPALAEVLAELQRRVPVLMDGLDLTATERRVLHLVAAASEPFHRQGQDTVRDWQGYLEDTDGLHALGVQGQAPLDATTDAALTALLELGLLPTDPAGREPSPRRRIAPLAPDDPIHAVLEQSP